MQFGVLGPLLVQDTRGPVTLASAKQRALLAILLLETPHVVPVERLVDELWGDRPPPTAAKALQELAVTPYQDLLEFGRAEERAAAERV